MFLFFHFQQRMGSSSELKREFVKKWAKGLQTFTSSKKEMSFLERKKAIKLSADVAMAASTRIKTTTTTTSWSCALIAKAKMDDNNAVVVENILGPDDESEKLWKCSSNHLVVCHKRFRSKIILKKSCGISKRARRMAPRMTVLATCVAKRLVKKRTQVLKSLVPGGESMDEFSLIKETLDYIISLRVQVDVMRHLANATEVLNCKKIDDSTSC